MKIGIVCPYDMSAPGGVQSIVVETHKRMVQRGHLSTIISVEPAKPAKIPGCVHFGTSLKLQVNGSTTNIGLENAKTRTELAAFLSKEAFDVVVIHEPMAPFLNWEVINFAAVKKIGWFHSSGFVDFQDFPMNLVIGPVEAWLRPRLEGVIAVSTVAKKAWAGMFVGNRGKIIPSGIDIASYRTTMPMELEGNPRILFVGRLDDRKGVLELILAMPDILRHAPKAVLWIVGDGPRRVDAEKEVQRLGIEKSVRFTGRVNEEEKLRYFRSCDVFCAPALGGESLGIVLLEAMAAGLPVVAYANPGYKTVLTDPAWDGQLVRVGARHKLAESVLAITGQAEVRRKVLKWQEERVAVYDWEKVMDEFEAYVSQVVKGEKSSPVSLTA